MNTEMFKWRVLGRLGSGRLMELTDITVAYNKHYPPSLIAKVIGIKVPEHDIKKVLGLLIKDGLVDCRPYSFTDRAHNPPLMLYIITHAGMHHLGKKT